MVAINHRQLRRLYEAAERDRNPRRFFAEINTALEKKELVPTDFSIRQLFENFVEDGRELADSYNPRHGGGVQFLEAGTVNTSLFANISGQIVYSAVMDAFAMEDNVFSKLIPTIPTQFNGEKVPGIGRMGDNAEVVAEGQEYPTVGVGEDWIETPQTTKRGLIVPITKEAIFFDRTGLMIERCREVGEWLGVNKEKRLVDCVIDENTTAHRYRWKGTTYATYQTSTPYDNVTASNALVDWTDLDAAEQTLNGILDPNTGEPIQILPKHLVCAKQLEATAFRILNATEIRVATPGYATTGNPTETQVSNPYRSKYQLVTSRLLASRMATDTDWFLGDVQKAFKYMENWPVTVVQSADNSHDEFHRDIVTQFKASERGAASTHEPRVMNKSTVA